MIDINILIKSIDEFRESQGLDKHHWKRKEAYKAHLGAMIKGRLPFGELEKECLQYLKDDGEDIKKYQEVKPNSSQH